MALDRKKLVQIVKDKCANIETINNSTEKYRTELYAAVTDIIYQESLHQEKATKIQQKIKDIISRLSEASN